MSFLNFFKRRSRDHPIHEAAHETTEEFLSSVGVNNGTDAGYRERRIASLLELADDSNADKILEVADKWVVSHWVDHEGEESWLPNPIWDDEGPVHRRSFASYSEARDYVKSLGGSLLEDEPVEE